MGLYINNVLYVALFFEVEIEATKGCFAPLQFGAATVCEHCPYPNLVTNLLNRTVLNSVASVKISLI